MLQEAMLARGMVEGRLLKSCFQSWHLGRVVGTGLAALGHSRGGAASTTAEHGAGCMASSLKRVFLAKSVRHAVGRFLRRAKERKKIMKSIFIHLVERRRSRLKPSLLNPAMLQALAS